MKEHEKEKNINLIVVLAIILVPLLFASMGWYFGTRYANKKSNQEEQNNQKEEVVEKGEVNDSTYLEGGVVLPENLKKTLDWVTTSPDELINNLQIADYWKKEKFSASDLDKNYKIKYALLYVNKFNLSEDEMKEYAKEYLPDQAATLTIEDIKGWIFDYGFKKSDVDTVYKKLWDDEPGILQDIHYKYVKSIDAYVDNFTGGYTKGPGEDTEKYVYGYTENGNKVNVYIRFLYTKLQEENCPNNAESCIRYYTNIPKDDYYIVDFKDYNPMNGLITKDNFTKFAKYKLTFEKVDDLYKFIDAEMI